MKFFSRARTNERAQRGVSELDGENDKERSKEKRREEKRREEKRREEKRREEKRRERREDKT